MKGRLSLVILGILLLLTAGCSTAPCGDPLRSVAWVDVAGRDLNCSVRPVAARFSPQSYDITDDGIADTFVAMKCPNGAGPHPYQVEVFDGASNPENPVRIGVLARSMGVPRHQMVFLDDGCLYFSDRTVVMRGKMYVESDSSPQPQYSSLQTDTWRGRAFDARTHQVSRQPLRESAGDPAVPACPAAT